MAKFLTLDGLTRFYEGLKSKFAALNHTHNYAGSGSAGGAANSADKLSAAKSFALTGDVTGTASSDLSSGASIAATLSNSGVTAGTYKSVTVDAKGRVTDGTNPTTKAGYGITDMPTTTEMNTAIANAVSSAGHLKRSVVSSLPAVASADADTIYMLAKSTSDAGYDESANVYTEYMVINNKWEKIGDTSVDLTDYLKSSEIVAITNAEIDAILAG